MNSPRDDTVTARPRLHFTAPRGWLNDPHGICWAGGEYHLFYQHNPAGNEWSSGVGWGHAVAPDLMQWRHLPIALEPHPGEGGCWTGATVVQNDRPVIFYTSVPETDWSLGRIARAHPDDALRHWHSGDGDVLIDGPPEGLGAGVFRDPCIFATDDGWTMVVGVGVQGGTGLVVQYTSTDLTSWTYDGVVCSRPTADTDGVWTGSMWECPQLFKVGDDWALVVSVWDDDTLFYCAGAIGSYDGRTFEPEKWSRLTHDDIAYAMTSFVDRAGRSCVMFWLREDSDHEPTARDWAGALSLPMLATVSPDRTLTLEPHPDVTALRQASPVHQLPSVDRTFTDATGTDVDAVVGRGDHLTFELTQSGSDLVVLQTVDQFVEISVTGRDPVRVPRRDDRIRIIVDVGLIEIFAGNGSASFRFAERCDHVDLKISGRASELTVHHLGRRGAEDTVRW